MDKADEVVWKHFHIKRNDVLPFSGWAGGRAMLPLVYQELGYKVGVEIGTREGIYAEEMCKVYPDMKLYCVDPWRAFSRNPQEKLEEQYEIAKKRLDPYNVVLVRRTSMEALSIFENESLDFVYIDALHSFNGVMTDILFWQRKVRIGGIVAGHDYFKFYQAGIITAVNAFTLGNNINPWYVTRKDRDPSWFYVKHHRCYDEEWI